MSNKTEETFLRLYRITSLILSIIFITVGFLFLLIPGKVLSFFNTVSGDLGFSLSPVDSIDFYIVLAVAYMYLAALLAFLMWRHPENRHFPLLLAHGKIASSLLSILLFTIRWPYLIFLVNFVVDGLIGVVALMFSSKIKRTAK
ncbi:MAG: hypothetical protein PVF66_05845 [Candidatus Aminicenantes bacterium]|jgi:hypothetical protein